MRIRAISILLPASAALLFACVSFVVQPGFTAIGLLVTGVVLLIGIPVGFAARARLHRLLRGAARGKLFLSLVGVWALAGLLTPGLIITLNAPLIFLLTTLLPVRVNGVSSFPFDMAVYGGTLLIALPPVAIAILTTAAVLPIAVAERTDAQSARVRPGSVP
jgi:hypothetical protein